MNERKAVEGMNHFSFVVMEHHPLCCHGVSMTMRPPMDPDEMKEGWTVGLVDGWMDGWMDGLND